MPAPGAAMGWHSVLERLHQAKPNLASYVEQGRLVEAGDPLVVEFDDTNAFAVGLIQKGDNEALIGRIVAEVFGAPRRLKWSIGASKRVAERAAERAAVPASERRQTLLEQSLAHPVVREAIDVLGGEVVDVRDLQP
jgi:DNA polymerase-3 subunit gamma/tau